MTDGVGIDAMSIGTVLTGVGTLASAAAIFFGAWLASSTWRTQKRAERRSELAERILTATYNARMALDHVRNPLVLAREQYAAEVELKMNDWWASVDDGRKQRVISAQTYFGRLNDVIETRNALNDCLPMARALFGEAIEKALDTLHRQFHIVSVSADMSSEDGNDPEFTKQLRADLSSSSSASRPNKMNAIIIEQVELIEGICLPVLRMET